MTKAYWLWVYQDRRWELRLPKDGGTVPVGYVWQEKPALFTPLNGDGSVIAVSPYPMTLLGPAQAKRAVEKQCGLDHHEVDRGARWEWHDNYDRAAYRAEWIYAAYNTRYLASVVRLDQGMFYRNVLWIAFDHRGKQLSEPFQADSDAMAHVEHHLSRLATTAEANHEFSDVSLAELIRGLKT